jgi:hypothetical protein
VCLLFVIVILVTLSTSPKYSYFRAQIDFDPNRLTLVRMNWNLLLPEIDMDYKYFQ